MYKLGICILILASINIVTAIDVDDNVFFITSDTNTTYHIADNFICNEIIVNNTFLYIDNGKIISYPDTGWLNMSLELLNDKSNFYFSNNITTTNITITNGFAEFQVKNKRYDLCYQSNDSVFSYMISDSEKIIFVNIPPNNWYIIKDGMFKKISEILEHLSEPLILIKDKFFKIIPFIISIILFAGFGLAIMVMTSRLKKW